MDQEERYLEAVTSAEAKASRVLVTLLFTDIVGSTEHAAELGDRAWTKLIEAHHTRVRELLTGFEGREVDCAGDGFFATFDTASRAIGCGDAITASVRPLGSRFVPGFTPESASASTEGSGASPYTRRPA